MKKCIGCNSEVDDGAYVCPKCGGGTFGYYGHEGWDTAVESMENQNKAKEHVDRSVQFAINGNFKKAIAEVEAALKISPLNPTAHGNMGCFLLNQGKPKEAIPWLEKAIKLNPQLNGIAEALERAKDEAGDLKSSHCFIARLEESIGIETFGNTFTKLIASGTPIPYECKEVFSTAADNQTEINIKVLSGNSTKANNNTTIGEFKIVGIPKASRGKPQIEVSFCVKSNTEFVLKANSLNDDTEVNVMKKGENGLYELIVDRSEKIDKQTRNEPHFRMVVDDTFLVEDGGPVNNSEMNNSKSPEITGPEEPQCAQEQSSKKPVSMIKVVFLFPFACVMLAFWIFLFFFGISAPFTWGGVISLVFALPLSAFSVLIIVGIVKHFRLLFSEDPERKYKGADGVCTFGLVGLILSVVFSVGVAVIELVAPSHPKNNKISNTVKHTEVLKKEGKKKTSAQVTHFEVDGISFDYPSTLSVPDKTVFDIEKVRKMLSPSGVEILSVSTSQIAPFPDQSIALSNYDLCRIYVYRDSSSLFSSTRTEIYDGQTYIGNLEPYAYLCWEKETGHTELIRKSEGEAAYAVTGPGFLAALAPHKISFDTEKGNIYYVRLSSGKGLQLIEEGKARKGFLKCDPPVYKRTKNR